MNIQQESETIQDSDSIDKEDETSLPHKIPAAKNVKHAGRKPNATFEIDPSCLLSNTFVIKTRSKHCIPKLFPKPPNFAMKKWNPVQNDDMSSKLHQKAHQFDVYALILHRPWNVNTHAPDALNWTAFLQYFSSLCTSQSVMSIVQREWIMVLAEGFNPDIEIKIKTMKYRYRKATIWKDPDVFDKEPMFNRAISSKSKKSTTSSSLDSCVVENNDDVYNIIKDINK